MVFYLAILLILCGFLIIVFGLFIEISEKNEKDNSLKINKPEEYRAMKKNSFDDFRRRGDRSRSHAAPPITMSFNDFKPEYNEPENLEIILPDELDNKDNIFSEFEDSIYAVMFDDRSDIIDYRSGIGIIDSSFLKYKDLKRIGRGIIESDSDGINFYLDEKLYRFDLHRIYDLWCGANYVALPLKGNGTVKLFIIENSPDFSDKVESDFKRFEKVSS